jgi:hypothetical protein
LAIVLSVLFPLAIVLSVLLRCTDSDCLFCIFKLFFEWSFKCTIRGGGKETVWNKKNNNCNMEQLDLKISNSNFIKYPGRFFDILLENLKVYFSRI